MTVRYHFVKIICLAALTLLILPKTGYSQSNESKGMGRGEINFNPAGFLQFGPMVDAGIRVGPSTFIDANFRWSYAGLAYQLIETDSFTTSTVEPVSAGAGIKVIHCFLNNYSPHCLYVGGLIEYTWGGDYGTDDDRDWKRSWTGYAVAANVGYRWRFPSGLFMQAGGFVGFHNQTDAEWYYEDDKNDKHSDPEGTRIFGMLEFSIGKEFGL